MVASKPSDCTALRQKWRKQIEDIKRQVCDLAQGYEYLRRSLDVLRESGRPANRIYQWVVAMYVRDAAVHVRRLLDRSKGTLSLRRLLNEIRKHPRCISRDEFVERYVATPGGREGATQAAQAALARLVAGNHESIPPAEIDKDVESLEQHFRDSRLQEIVDTRVAHLSTNEHDPDGPTLIQLGELVSTAQRVCWRYYFLLHRVELGHQLVWRAEPDLDAQIRKFWLGQTAP